MFVKKLYTRLLTHEISTFPINHKVSLKENLSYIYRHFVYQTLSQSTMSLKLNDVIKKLESIAPLNLAESWDNVGLLVEPERNSNVNSVLLTIDLTEDVVHEAADIGSQLIISYHPNIFRPLKSITQSSWKERIIIECIKNNIAVFSPHTTWDAMNNGVNNWLASVFNIKSIKPIIPNSENSELGMGRLVDIVEPVSLKNIVHDLKRHIGIPHLRLGLARGNSLDTLISKVALCAGSGSSVLSNINADLYLTGEMLHHDVLDATQKGINVILCNHSDSERGYLKHFQNILTSEQLQVNISKIDKDCLTTI
ncbi:NIF3-like protein 1 [Sitophilus oryzae]|uniref:NIF3-like protein 1 n=1 Tax=Sitophilus oryzae TaxID=7048 RepID=A0A6J2YHX9_SITOR|nr:NIF3-like protein 1 [Sitophilus oryzae]